LDCRISDGGSGSKNRVKRKRDKGEERDIEIEEVHFEETKKKKLEQLTEAEITRFVAEQDIHKLQVLTDSIARNGVQVPLIICSDGRLLDGNRRYFACQWLKIQSAEKKKPISEVLQEIPVWVIKKEDLSETTELKILAEANFITDLQVKWPLDAQARAVDAFYRSYRKEKKADHDTALEEVVSVFGITRQRAVDLLDTLALTLEFIDEAGSDSKKVQRREIVEEKFVYFWEFRNKAQKGRGALKDPAELREVRGMFFAYMAKGNDNPIKNVKQVEPLIQARRDKTAWAMLIESKGAKLEIVVSMVNENKAGRNAEDKIRAFLAWLEDVGDGDLNARAKGFLAELAKLATKKSKN